MKEVSLGNKPTEDYHLTMQLPSALQCVLASLSPLFWFCSPQIYCLAQSYHSHPSCFQQQNVSD